MITVKAIYDRGKVEFLEPVPDVERALVAVVFLEVAPAEVVLASYGDVLSTMAWGEPMDEEGAFVLMAIHEEMAPYRVEAEGAYLASEGEEA